MAPDRRLFPPASGPPLTGMPPTRSQSIEQAAAPMALQPDETVKWSDQPAMTRLERICSDPEGFIERKAAELAAPAIAEARRSAVASEQRMADLQQEFGRKIRALERQLAQAREKAGDG
jgi:hypothetical protein